MDGGTRGIRCGRARRGPRLDGRARLRRGRAGAAASAHGRGAGRSRGGGAGGRAAARRRRQGGVRGGARVGAAREHGARRRANAAAERAAVDRSGRVSPSRASPMDVCSRPAGSTARRRSRSRSCGIRRPSAGPGPRRCGSPARTTRACGSPTGGCSWPEARRTGPRTGWRAPEVYDPAADRWLALRSVAIWSPRTGRWSRAPDLAQPRASAAAALVPGTSTVLCLHLHAALRPSPKKKEPVDRDRQALFFSPPRLPGGARQSKGAAQG